MAGATEDPPAGAQSRPPAEPAPPQPAWMPPSGVPGELVVFGPHSHVWLVGLRKNMDVPVGAIASAGRGRLVALAHDAFVGRADDTPKHYEWLPSAVRWAAATTNSARRLRVAVVAAGGAARALRAAGFEVEDLTDATALDSADVVVAVGRRLGPELITPLAEYVERGGGLIIAETAWSWDGQGRPLGEHPANRLCARWGIVWTDRTCELAQPDGAVRPAADARRIHALHAFEALRDGGPDTDPAAAIATIETAMRYVPENDQLLKPRLRDWLEAVPFEPPTAERPVRVGDVARRLAITHALLRALAQPPGEMRALPGIESFPGVSPSHADRGRRELVLDLAPEGWISTGLYVPAGEPVRLELPPEALAAKLTVRIGAHTDEIWHLTEWKRYPEITCRFHLMSTPATVASPFGGLLYLERHGPVPAGFVTVAVHGAIEAPLFRLGHTTADEWQRRRDAPAPWGELAGRRLILTLPSDRLRRLDDPVPVLELWDRVLDACAELAGRPSERTRPERIVPDLQISAGYMHSGYPIMTHADQYDVLANRDAILRGPWGLFHELGHNHQQRDWTFDGAGEVTVNLFTLYVLENVCGRPPLTGHPEIRPHVQERLRRRYVAGGRRFEEWKANPFLALGMYMQLREAFGWDPFRRVFAEYRALPPHERPRTDDQRRDQWLVRFSKAVGRNLGPFFESWGIPTSDRARAEIAHLPPWMPVNWPPAESEASQPTQ